jgi:4-carboxymuconolactone decarboxylase
MRADRRQVCTGMTVLALTLGLALTSAHAQQIASEPQAMSNNQATSQTLSAKQQAIPLIAASMAASDIPKLNAALNRSWTPA